MLAYCFEELRHPKRQGAECILLNLNFFCIAPFLPKASEAVLLKVSVCNVRSAVDLKLLLLPSPPPLLNNYLQKWRVSSFYVCDIKCIGLFAKPHTDVFEQLIVTIRVVDFRQNVEMLFFWGMCSRIHKLIRGFWIFSQQLFQILPGGCTCMQVHPI